MSCSLPLLPLKSINLDKHLWYMAIQNLIYSCRNLHLTIVVNIFTSEVSSNSLKWLPSLSNTHKTALSNRSIICIFVAGHPLSLDTFTTLNHIVACTTVRHKKVHHKIAKDWKSSEYLLLSIHILNPNRIFLQFWNMCACRYRCICILCISIFSLNFNKLTLHYVKNQTMQAEENNRKTVHTI